mgnify:CR=1 FL=1
MRKIIFVIALALIAGGCRDFKGISIDAGDFEGDDLAAKAVSVFGRVAAEKTGSSYFVKEKGGPLTITLNADSSIPEESFEIDRPSRNKLIIKASEGHGILYGLGKVLHDSKWSEGRFSPGNFEGLTSPDKPVRGIYFATHFRNYYHEAPIEEVEKYVEDLALWGYNGLQVWFDMHHYAGIDDPEAIEMMDRLAAILRAGEAVGMRSGLTMLANEGYNTTPEELKASKISWTAHYGCEICPSKPGGTELILKNRSDFLDAFAAKGVHIKNIWLWPYDQGGCSCPDCSVWGANGYLRITRPLAEMMREKLPGVSVVLSTWLFDFEEEDKGEWKGLAKAFSEVKPWVDAIMADSHADFPSYLRSHDVPGHLPLENFPEISMWNNYPWGGYGANPLPERFHRLYHQCPDGLLGGFPYSEGKFEDINKVIYSRLYWEKDISAREALKEYVSFEYSDKAADKICDAIEILEKNMGLKTRNWIKRPDLFEKKITVPEDDFGAAKAYSMLLEAEKNMTAAAKESWRWQILLKRAYLDMRLRETNGEITPDVNEAFRSLVEISFVQEGEFAVRPPYVKNEE